MSELVLDNDEFDRYRDPHLALWELYMSWCQQHHTRPSIKDFLVWKEEQGYDEEDEYEPEW